jgi:hypothetical protein
MARIPNKLSDDVKAAIVQALACFDGPSVVVAAIKADFGINVSAQQVETYDPNKRAGARLSKRWRALFEHTRKNFKEDAGAIPIANRSMRLRALHRMAERAEKQGNLGLAAKLHEQAAREMGDAYTNRVDHRSGDGSMSPPKSLAEFYAKPPANAG